MALVEETRHDRGFSRWHAGFKQAAGTVLVAMSVYPSMVGGEGRFCTELMRVTKGRIIGKLGADGIYCAAERDGGWALAAKIEDGNATVAPAAVIQALKQFSLLSDEEYQALHGFAKWDILNCCGEKVGETKAAFHMELA